MKWLKYSISIILWSAMMYFLYRTIKNIPMDIDWREGLKGQRLLGLILFGLAFLLAYILRLWRFGYLIRLTEDVKWRDIIFGFPGLFLMGAITPLRLGEAYRSVWVKKHKGSSASVLGYWVAERYTDLAILLTFVIIGLLYSQSDAMNSMKPLLGLALFGIAIGYLVICFCQNFIKNILSSMRAPAVLSDMVDSFAYMKNPALHAKIVVVSCLIWALMVLGFGAVFTAYLGSVDHIIPLSISSVALVNLAAVISVSPGNVGSFQAAITLAAVLYAAPIADLLVASVYIQLVGLSIIVILGALAMMINVNRGKNVD